MKFTEDILEQGKSRNGGWSKEQLKTIGITESYRGWKKDVLGKDIDENDVNHFLRIKDAHLKGTLKEKSDGVIAIFWDINSADMESHTFYDLNECDEFCNIMTEKTNKSVFVIRGEVEMKYYPWTSKRKGNLEEEQSGGER